MSTSCSFDKKVVKRGQENRRVPNLEELLFSTLMFMDFPTSFGANILDLLAKVSTLFLTLLIRYMVDKPYYMITS